MVSYCTGCLNNHGKIGENVMLPEKIFSLERGLGTKDTKLHITYLYLAWSIFKFHSLGRRRPAKKLYSTFFTYFLTYNRRLIHHTTFITIFTTPYGIYLIFRKVWKVSWLCIGMIQIESNRLSKSQTGWDFELSRMVTETKWTGNVPLSPISLVSLVDDTNWVPLISMTLFNRIYSKLNKDAKKLTNISFRYHGPSYFNIN